VVIWVPTGKLGGAQAGWSLSMTWCSGKNSDIDV
jgi:hypothetical protein